MNDTSVPSVKWDVRFLKLAVHVASWSKDPRTNVGAVIVRPDRTIAALGFNGFARGVSDTEERYNDRETKHAFVVHAELNAILSAASDLRGTTMYVAPMFPCRDCAKAICQTGISRLVYSAMPHDGHWAPSQTVATAMFKECGITTVNIPYTLLENFK